jgi:hypothetical protein
MALNEIGRGSVQGWVPTLERGNEQATDFPCGYLQREIVETYPKIAITFNNTKEAALYFDYVVPFGSNFEWIVDSLIRNRGETHCKRPQDVTLPPILRENNSFSLDLYRVTQMHSS